MSQVSYPPKGIGPRSHMGICREHCQTSNKEAFYEKQKRLRHDKIKPDPYAKRTARSAAATPALQNNSVGPASRTTDTGASSFLDYPHPAVARTHGTNARRRFRQALCGNRSAPHLTFHQSQLPCLTKSTPTLSSGKRFTTTCASNIQNGSSQMADVQSVILMSHALRNYSKLSRKRVPTSLSLLFIASSNRNQTESTPQHCNASGALCSRVSITLPASW